MIRRGLRILLVLTMGVVALHAHRGWAAAPPPPPALAPANLGWDRAFGALGARRWGGGVRRLAAGPTGTLYAAGALQWIGAGPNTLPTSPTSELVARWDGTDWTMLGVTDGIITALLVDDSGLYVGGLFTHINGVAVPHLAYWDGSTWAPVHGDLADLRAVLAIVRWNTTLFVAGVFMRNGQVDQDIARWDGAAWQSMRTRQGAMQAMAAVVAGPDGLYVGGEFATFNDVPAANIARWDGATWAAVGDGVPMEVRDLAVDGAAVYAAGAADIPGGALARWSSGAWSLLGAGGPSIFDRVAVAGSAIYGVSHTGTWPAVWRRDGTTWSRRGETNGAILTVAIAHGLPLIGGDFHRINGLEAVNLAQDGPTGWRGWSAAGGLGIVRVLTRTGATLYAGGFFDRIGGVRATNIARWDGAGWAPLATGIDGEVFALAAQGTSLYVGGQFHQAGAAPTVNIAQWDGTRWGPLAQEMTTSLDSPYYPSNTAYAIALFRNELYVGGVFTHIDGREVRGLARWDGQAWSAVGGGVNGGVVALATDGRNLYVGGAFTKAGTQAITGLARWDGQTWTSMGANLTPNDAVLALAWADGQLYAGGRFPAIGGVASRGIARWDGQQWHGFGGGVEPVSTNTATGGLVHAVTVRNGAVYIGGTFERVITSGGAGEAPTALNAPGVARWDGHQWGALGSGISPTVYALTATADGLYAGGWFGVAGDTPSVSIARWAPRTYLPLAVRQPTRQRSQP